MRNRSQINIDEIDSSALSQYIKDGKLDDPNGITRVFKHRYDGGQCDWGYIDHDGYYWAWFGGDYEITVDNPEDLEIIKEWPLEYVIR